MKIYMRKRHGWLGPGFARLFTLALATTAGEAAEVRHPEIPAVFLRTGSGVQCGFVLRGPAISGSFRNGSIEIEGQGVKVGLVFLGTTRIAKPEIVADETSAYSAFMGADSRRWVHATTAYTAIRYPELYPGIDLVYRVDARRLKSEFRLRSRTDPSQIRFRYLGPSVPEIDSGNLVMRTLHGEFREAAPVAWQDTSSGRRYVDAAYETDPDGSVHFHLGAYETDLPLVIDPVLRFSSFYGGSQNTVITGVAADGLGNFYFTGWTDGAVAPLTGELQRTSRGGIEALVGKIDASGSLAFVSYLGGTGSDKALGIAVDANGIVITGNTSSPDFPTLNAAQHTLRGSRNAFVVRLNLTGTQLIYSTYLGGTGQESGNGVGLDAAGNAYIAGETTSTNLPVLAGIRMTSGGGSDAFVAKLSLAGRLVYSSYFGGSLDDRATALAITAGGFVAIAGETQSADLPVLNAAQASAGGGKDAFIACIDASGAALLFSTYLGGSGGNVSLPESATGVAIDASGDIYVTGVTSSTDFPTSGLSTEACGVGQTAL